MNYAMMILLALSTQAEAQTEATQRASPTVEDLRLRRQQEVETPAIPELDAIADIVAEAYSHPLPVHDIPPFKISKGHHRELLDFFRTAERDDSLWPENTEIGSIRVSLVGGRTLRVCWFWVGHKDRLCFSCGGIRYRSVGKKFASDETLKVDAYIRQLYEDSVQAASAGR